MISDFKIQEPQEHFRKIYRTR